MSWRARGFYPWSQLRQTLADTAQAVGPQIPLGLCSWGCPTVLCLGVTVMARLCHLWSRPVTLKFCPFLVTASARTRLQWLPQLLSPVS